MQAPSPLRAPTLLHIVALTAAALAHEETWTSIYVAPPGPLIAQTYLAADGDRLTVYLIGPAGEVERRTLDDTDTSVPSAVLGPAGARYFTSPNGLRLGRADAVEGPDELATRLTVFEGEGEVVATMTVGGSAEFLLSGDGSMVVSAVPVGHSRQHRIALFEGNGTPRSLPWTGGLESERVFALRLSRDGRRLGAVTPGRTAVYDTTPSATAAPVFEAASTGVLRLSPDGSVAALIDHAGVSFSGPDRADLRVDTQGPVHDVAFAPTRWAAVADARRLYVVDLDIPAIALEQDLAPAGSHIGALDLVLRGQGVRIAVGSLEVASRDAAEARLHVIDLAPGATPIVHSWPAFDTSAWNGHSPRVQFVAGGTRVLAGTRDRLQVSSGLP